MRRIVIPLAVLACAASGAAPLPPTRGASMQYGPILTCTVEAPPLKPVVAAAKPDRPAPPAPPSADALARIVARKGIVVKLGQTDEASVCFDTDTLRMGAGWTDGFLDLSQTNIGTYKGNYTGAGVIAGKIVFQTADGPGWSRDRKFDDPRAGKAGPLPREQGRFKGVYLHDQRVVFSYNAGGCDVLDSPSFLARDGRAFFVRRFTAGPCEHPLYVRVADGRVAGEANPDLSIHGEIVGDLAGLALERSDAGALLLRIPPHQDVQSFAVALWNEAVQDRPVDVQHIIGTPPDLRDYCQGGPSRWQPVLETKGTRATDDTAYVVDTVMVPDENPWKSWMRLSALDFFPDGRAAVTTLNGDVWIVSRLDEKLERVQWKRFAVGLYEPLGLKIADGKIYVHGRDQLTRLHDLNGDGEADFYECFNNDRVVYPSYHAYAYDLQTDRAGNFYYVVGGAWLGTERPWHACLVKVSPDGGRSEIIATGFRAPNGMAIGPGDEITISDNQGNWTPASKISLVRPGGFYGFVADTRVEPDAKAPESFDQPICWIPQALDNSSAGQVWAPANWGPFGGGLLHTSYGTSAVFAVLQQRVGDVTQGGVVKLPLKFDSGIMRARFNPHDGQLYLAGLKGWQTSGAKDGCLQRVRYTGRPVRLPTALRVAKDAIAITFPEPLHHSATDPDGYALEQWNYKWSKEYGSPDFSVAEPGRKGCDIVEVIAVELSKDRMTATLKIPALQPVMQMSIKLNVQAADGAEIRTEIANTIHRVPAQ